MNVITEDKAIQIASGEYLTESLPDDWSNWDGIQVDDFILEHVTEAFENLDVSDIWDCINVTSQVLIEVSTNTLKGKY